MIRVPNKAAGLVDSHYCNGQHTLGSKYHLLQRKVIASEAQGSTRFSLRSCTIRASTGKAVMLSCQCP